MHSNALHFSALHCTAPWFKGAALSHISSAPITMDYYDLVVETSTSYQHGCRAQGPTIKPFHTQIPLTVMSHFFTTSFIDTKKGSQILETMTHCLIVNETELWQVWFPDVEIRNLQSFDTHHILSKLEGFWVDNDHNLMHALASRFMLMILLNIFP
jgi:hypothetical protein